MLRHLMPCICALLAAAGVHAQAPATLSLAPDSPRWELEGRASVADYLGRKCLMLDGAAAAIRDFSLRDGIIKMVYARTRLDADRDQVRKLQLG